MSNDTTTPEQAARDMLERMDMPDAQSLSAGDVGEVSQAIAEAWKYRRLTRALPLVAQDWITVRSSFVAVWVDGQGPKIVKHDGAPDSIAAAIIAAAEGA